MTVYKINPLEDSRWPSLVQSHGQASVFQAPGWLAALQRTYGFQPVAYTTSAPGDELSNGIVFCEVKSFLTGRRLVSLPFSDHCEPLVGDQFDLATLLQHLKLEFAREGWKYIEMRPLFPMSDEFRASTGLLEGQSFLMASIDLRAHADELFRNMHKSSFRDRIRRAAREGVTCEQGRSESLLRSFYNLLLVTRRRHGIPPQPLSWFQNLLRCMGDDLTIRLASKDGQPIASIITIRFNSTEVYKYGCSDAHFHNIGGMPLLLWNSIQDAKARGAHLFDLGRSEMDNTGLIEFKERLGAKLSPLVYYRYQMGSDLGERPEGFSRQIVRRLVGNMPDAVVTSLGRLLYRHVG